MQILGGTLNLDHHHGLEILRFGKGKVEKEIQLTLGDKPAPPGDDPSRNE
jgi:hypothetical protein